MTPVAIIILIIFLAGLLGGVTNYFLSVKVDNKPGENRLNFFKSILMGLCASIAVPLFLQVLPNSLLDISNNMPVKNYLILAGLCVLTSYFSKRFLEDLYERVTNAEKKAEEAKQAVEEVENQNTEIDDIDEVVEDIITRFDAPQERKDITLIADAVLNTPYSYRTVHGISEDTLIDDNKVREILELIKKAGYVDSKKNAKGKDIWKSTYRSKIPC
jgi:hypothetical protein